MKSLCFFMLIIVAVSVVYPQNKKVLKPEMIKVEGGTFTMGDNSDGNSECPFHKVTLSGFLIGKTEVTFESFSKFIQATGYETDAEDAGWSILLIGYFMEARPGVDWRSDTKGNRRSDAEKLHPVILVSWNDAIAYCNWLSEQEGLQKTYSGCGSSITCDFKANGYRLPTEAEWEYAARGGNKSKGYKYSGSNKLDEVGWYGGFSNNGNREREEGTSEVGKKLPNELGIYDMSGNVDEWCWDWYGETYYRTSPGKNPKGPDTGVYRVYRRELAYHWEGWFAFRNYSFQ
ncbi:formylglycine-generating enzyme family protein [Ignavibacteriales bacterium]